MLDDNGSGSSFNRLHDKTGLVYGRLKVICRDNERREGTYWICECQCGNRKSVHANSLTKGLTQSCGCFHKEVASVTHKTHGMTGTPEYRTWRAVINRCHNPQADNYMYYGARGVSVCDRWRNSFEAFYADMGPSNGLTIERIDNSRGYEPSNCRWANLKEQSKNRSSTKWVTYKGETISFVDFAAMFDIPYNTLRNRINAGMSPEDAVSKRWLQKKV